MRGISTLGNGHLLVGSVEQQPRGKAGMWEVGRAAWIWGIAIIRTWDVGNGTWDASDLVFFVLFFFPNAIHCPDVLERETALLVRFPMGRERHRAGGCLRRL